MRIATAALLAVLLSGCGGDGEGGSAGGEPTPDPSVAAAASAEARRLAENAAASASASAAAAANASKAAAVASALAAVPPDPSEFALGVIVTEKQCFGSAGCTVTFRIDPKYVGAREVKSLEVTYEVSGGEDPLINTFTIDENGTAHYDGEETLRTPSSKSDLTAKVTSVRKDPTA